MTTLDITTATAKANFDAMWAQMRLSGKRVRIEILQDSRTDAQNNSMHLWFEMVAATLNAAGLDMRRAIREEVDIPWTKDSVKRYLWKPLQEAMTGHESTTKPKKLEYPEISDTLTRHFAQKFGVQLPVWPSREAA